MSPLLPNQQTIDDSDMIWQHLREVPAFRAIQRCMEGRLFREWSPWPRPLLDIGVGDGHFTQVVFGHAEAGIDLKEDLLRIAARRGVYAELRQADVTALPFADAQFATIVCNSSLEHISDLAQALRECFRVLRPGGHLAITVPTEQINQGIIGRPMLRRIGLQRLADHYTDWFVRKQIHYHLYSPEEWRRRVEIAGFHVIRQTPYFSVRAATWFYFGHFYGIPNLIWHRLTERWVIFPWRPLFFLEEKLIGALLKQEQPGKGTCCFLVAIKPPL